MTRFVYGLLSFSLCFFSKTILAQFSGPVGAINTSAMHKDSSAFVAWANSCKITRGLQDISAPQNGYASAGDSSLVLGMAGTNGVVSIGDGGSAIVQFNTSISDGNGHDFAVFENSFDGLFLELAFVEVSSDGVNYFKFPAISNTDTTIQVGTFDNLDATKIHNLAGKYRASYGTPFDLADIPANILLNKSAITHVKIIDVVGCIQNQYCSRDNNHHKINDPWPTPFASSGFDLDAVGVIHNQTNVGIHEFELNEISIFPNPAKDVLYMSINSPIHYSISIYSIVGEKIITIENESKFSTINTSDLKQGIYFLKIDYDNKHRVLKFIKS